MKYIHIRPKMALSLTLPKLAQEKIPGKNQIWKIREKSGFKIPAIFDQILRMEYIKYSFMVKLGSFFAIFANFDIFETEISQSIFMNSIKFRQICISHEIWIYTTQF